MGEKKIIYHCYGGAHSSVVAAAIHLGRLDPARMPYDRELVDLELFDRQSKDGHGQLHFFGFDEDGNQVYSVGCRNAGTAVENILKGVAGMLGAGKEVHFVDTLHCVNARMRAGGYLSRRLGLIRLGRPLVLSGTRAVYKKLVQLVADTKHKAKA